MANNTSRKVNSLKGIFSAVSYNLVKIIIQFIFRSVFIRYLGVEYLGVNSAISGVLNLLSVTELGIGSAITFNLYKPVAEKDTDKINALIKVAKKFYFIISIVVFCLGLILLPFLKYLIADSANINVNLYFVFILYLLNTVATYFCAYRNVLFTAYQHQYKSNTINLFVNLFSMLIYILFVVLFKNYYVYLITQFICSLVGTFVTYFISIKLYPNITSKTQVKLDEKTREDVNKNIKGMCYHKISYSILQGTDSLVISSFIGAVTLGIYSNYSIFTTSIMAVFSLILVSLAGSIGNLIAEGDSEKSYSIYKVLKMWFFWLAGFCSISLFVLLTPAINLWSTYGGWLTDHMWTFDTFTTFIIVLNFYLLASRSITGSFREATGDFYRDRIKGLVEAVINVVVSILLVKPLGIAGVLIGTIVSCLCTSFWVDPLMVYKYHFKKPLINHFRDVLLYSIIVLIAGIATYYCCRLIKINTILGFILQCFVCLIVPNLIMLLFLFPTKEFKNSIEMIKKLKRNNNYKNN